MAHLIFPALLLLGSAALIAAGIVGLSRYRWAAHLRRIDAEYRAAALVINTRRQLRAGQHRAAEREWGRA